MSDFEKSYPVIIEIKTAWGDMDAFAHVNNTMFFKYFESARIAYFEKIEMLSTISQNKIAPILAKASCKFIRPLFYPDTLLLGASIVNIDKTRLTMNYGIFSKGQNQLAATGDAVIVSLDFEKKTKVALPQNWLRLIESVEGKTISELSSKP